MLYFGMQEIAPGETERRTYKSSLYYFLQLHVNLQLAQKAGWDIAKVKNS
jgi:hypothetical protein